MVSVKLKAGLFFLLWMFLGASIYAQCYVNITSSSLMVCEGDTITLEAVGACDTIIIYEDFNNNTTGSGLYAQPGLWISWTNQCTVNPPASGTVATICAGAQRAIYTIPFSSGICDTIRVQWDMKFGSNDGGGCCEGPDATDEGIHLQVLTVNSWGYQIWQDLEYYPSNSAFSGPHYSWNSYDVKIPNLKLIPNVQPMTQLRWVQLAYTGVEWDHWMLDNVKISHQCDSAQGTVWTTNGAFAGSSPTLSLTPNTNTQVVVELFNNSSSVYDTVMVVVYSSIKDILGADTVICQNNSIAFNVDTIQGQLLWSNGSTNPITSYDSTILKYDSLIWLERTFKNGCVSRDSLIVLLDPCAGISEKPSPAISIFPNPAGEKITIQWEGQALEEVRLYNTMGREVAHLKIPGGDERCNIDVASLPAGLYLLQVRTANRTGCRQLVIR